MLNPTDIADPTPTPAADRGPGPLVTGVFEPPSSFVISAISRNKWIVALSAIVFAAAGVAFGHSRPVTYTATTTLQVGQVNPNSPGFYGYVQSSAALATAFSRAIAAEPVLTTVQHKLDLTPAKALGRLSAEPIPQAPAFRVIATGGSEHGAVALANVAAGAVVAYEGQSNSANPEAESLLHEYRGASVRVQHANEHLAHLARAKASKSELAVAEAEKNAQAARFRAIGSAYNAAILSQAPRSGLVTLLAGASSASSNRKSKLELYGFLGLLLGVVAGCGLAVMLERLRARRLEGGGGKSQRVQPA